MGGGDERAARSLVAAAGLHSDEAVFDQIDSSDCIARCNLIEQFNQLDGLQTLSVDRNGDTLLESNFNQLVLIRRVLRAACQSQVDSSGALPASSNSPPS